MQKLPRLLVATADGHLFIYNVDPLDGGECTLAHEHKWVYRPVSQHPLSARSVNSDDGELDFTNGKMNVNCGVKKVFGQPMHLQYIATCKSLFESLSVFLLVQSPTYYNNVPCYTPRYKYTNSVFDIFVLVRLMKPHLLRLKKNCCINPVTETSLWIFKKNFFLIELTESVWYYTQSMTLEITR